MEYIVAHGIASYVGEKRVVIGSAHFVFEDEKCRIRPEYQQRFDELLQYSHLYLAVDNVLEAVLCIEDPVREEAKQIIRHELKREGFTKIVMMTGDSERTAAAIVKQIGVTNTMRKFCRRTRRTFVQQEKEAGRRVHEFLRTVLLVQG